MLIHSSRYPTTLEADRKRFTTAGKSQQFIAFLQTELQPYVERRYKTNSSKTLIGQSLGRLLATEILFKKPYLFTKYITISPSLWWDNGSLLEQTPAVLGPGFTRQTDVFMEVDANLLAEKLQAAKSSHLRVYFDYLPQEDHATITHQAVFNAFRLLYPAKEQK